MKSSQISKDKPKSRHRVQFSCFACKKRKVKCDRGRPYCNVCISRKTTDCCYYPSSNSKTSQINIFHINKQIGNNNNNLDDSSNLVRFDNTENSCSDLSSIEDNKPVLSKYNNTRFISTEIKLIKQKLSNIENSIDIDSNAKLIKDRIEKLLFYLNIDINEKFNIYSDYKPMFYFVSRINGYGPLAWIALIMKDPFSQPILENILFEKFNNLKVSEIFYNHCIASPDIHDKTDYKTLENKKQNYEEYLDSNILPPKNRIIENLTYRELIDALPNKKIIWLLIDRFFKYVYPFAPYADQNLCLKQMQKILKVNKTKDLNSEDKIKFIDIKNKLDLAHVGCILIMLKLSYKTLIIINNGENPNSIRTDDEIYLKNHPLDDKIIDIVNYILEGFDLRKRCIFPVYQCALFLRFYQKIDGEDLSSQNECKISDNNLIQMASSLGMNRDPTKFEKPLPFSLCGSLGRKIWHCLVSIDNFKYFHEGIPKSIVDSFCDTKLPEFDAKYSNNNDLMIEKLTINLIRLKNEIEISMKPIADAICNIHNPPTVSYIMNLLENFEEKLLNKFGLFCELLDRPHHNNYYSKLSKVSEVLIVLEGVSLIFTVVLHLSLKFESMKLFSPSKFFSTKILTSIMKFIKMIPEISLLSHTYFGTGFDYIIIPTLETILCKSMIFITSNYVKFSILKHKLLKSKVLDTERLPLVENILHTFLYDIFNNRHLKVLKILSSNFFFAWRILKVQSYIFDLLKNEILSYDNQRNIFNFVEYLTSDDLMKILQLLNLDNYQGDNSNCNYFNVINKQYRDDICDEDPRSKEFSLHLNSELQKEKLQLYHKIDSSNTKTIGDNKNNLLLHSNEENTNQIFDSLLSADDDKFWIEMFQHNNANNQQNDIFRILDNLDYSHKNDNYHTDILFQDTPNDVVNISNQINNNDSRMNTSDGTETQPSNSFVDQAIFDLLF